MNPRQRKLSLAGCTSRADALERFERWLDEIGEEAQTRFETSLIATNAAAKVDKVDVDELADACIASREYYAEGRPAMIAQFLQWLDEHLPSTTP